MKSNLDPKVAAAVTYIPWLGLIACVIFLVIETNKDVRFHSVQSLLLELVVWILIAVSFITVIGPALLGFGAVILRLYMAYKAYKGEKMELPMLAAWSNQILEKISPTKK